MEHKIKLIEDLIHENPDATISDYCIAILEIENIEKTYK